MTFDTVFQSRYNPPSERQLRSNGDRPSSPVTCLPYHAKRILNKRQHADDCFWDCYSAAAYLGCEHACHHCYFRSRTCSPFDDPADFGRIVRVKVNAADRLCSEARRVPQDVVSTGDYQPAEAVYGLSRQMLQVCPDLRFPMVRPVAPDDPLALNKRIAQRLADESHHREIESATGYRVWAYRRAAWAVDDLQVSLADLYTEGGKEGPELIPQVRPRLAGRIGGWIEQL